MKQLSLFSLLTFLSLFLVGCSQESTKTSGSSSNPYCQYNPYSYGCPGYTGGTNGGQNPYCQMNPQAQGCPQFCQYYPTHASCVGSTTGGTTGGQNQYCQVNPYAQGCPYFCQYNPTHPSCVSGGTTGGTGTNPYQNYPSSAMNPNWGMHYPPTNEPPAGDASTCVTFTPDYLQSEGITPWDTRVGTVSIAGYNSTIGTVNPYDPSLPVASNYLNTSPDLKSVNGTKMFLMTDSMLKIRFKPRPQPDRMQTPTSCFGASNTSMSTMPGYTKLSFNVVLRGIKSNGSHVDVAFKSYNNVGVNSCTSGWDISQYKAQYPNGIYFVIQAVRGNQGCSGNTYWVNGFGSCNTNHHLGIRSVDCWTMDVEVAADGTKSFN